MLKEAVAKSIELWEWLAKTGSDDKYVWFNSKGIYGFSIPIAGCYLCLHFNGCNNDCPLHYCCFDDAPFNKWINGKTKRTRRKYAQQVVDQLKAWQEKHGH